MGGKTKVSTKEKEALKEQEKNAAKAAKQEDEDWAAAGKPAGEGKKTKAQAKRDDKDASKQEAAAKKLEAKRLLEEEEAKLAASKAGPSKVTRHQLAQVRAKDEQLSKEQQEKREQERRRELGEEEYARIIEIENRNRDDSLAEARDVDSALAALAVADEAPKMKFSQYQERELPELRSQKPGLKAPQYKDILWKKWLRSPENPLNKPAA